MNDDAARLRRPYRWVVLAVYTLVAGLSQLLWLNFAPLLTTVEQRYGVSELWASTLVMAFPLLVRSARTAFEEVDPRLVGLARTLGAGPVAAFFRITLPLARRGVLAGTVLAFSRALGEFGATIMVAGNIPGRTQTLALAIFHDVQIGRDDRALGLAAVTVGLSFVALWTTEWIVRRRVRGDET